MRRLAVLALLGLAMPATAQFAPRHDYEDVGPANPFIGDSSLHAPPVRRELREIRSGVDHARDSGMISRGEARRLNREARQIGRLAERYGRDGLSSAESRELQGRTVALRAAVARSQQPPAGK
ncbi:hypothetical protein [Sphingosinicella sp. BN140058]|uniref:hypothetical protein n=1 Tax=Sphingosinicella sp. BN140058 TaxID=1892855 RepID=UPI001011A59A|nr:hypothetical protein [Sphingosinicella sp. BN140058]QAY75754.1 hypothetical protein ETR14_03825 [Sphingosinicella sp. BN140058]